MSPRTLFLSKLIRLYCILAALSMMTRRQDTSETVSTLLQNPSMMLVLGVITLAGCAGDGARARYLVGRCTGSCDHPRRLDNAHQKPTLLIPAALDGSEFSLAQLHHRQFFYLYGAISLALGVYLSYRGFTARSHWALVPRQLQPMGRAQGAIRAYAQ